MKVAFISTFQGGLGYWRSWSVEKWIKRLSLAETRSIRASEANIWWTREQAGKDGVSMEEVFEWADVVAMQRVEQLEHLSYTRAMRDHFKKKLVMDIDDDVYHIEPDNPAFNTFNRKPEDSIQISEVPLLEGSTPVEIETEEGKRFVNIVGASASYIAQKQMSFADLVITSTPSLARSYSNDAPRIEVIQNAIDLEDFKLVSKRKEDTVRIGWAGGAAHYQDIESIAGVLKDVCSIYPQVRLVLANCPYDFRGQIPEDQIEYQEFVDIADWPGHFGKMQLDIGIAPLVDNLFNRSKSNIKWLENASQKTPIVCSAVEPYLESIVDGFTGYVARSPQEWFEKLKLLIESSEERSRIGKNAYDEVLERWTMERRAHEWADAFKGALG